MKPFKCSFPMEVRLKEWSVFWSIVSVCFAGIFVIGVPLVSTTVQLPVFTSRLTRARRPSATSVIRPTPTDTHWGITWGLTASADRSGKPPPDFQLCVNHFLYQNTHDIFCKYFRCEYCNKSFSKPSRLEAHVKSHHNNIRDFKCSECNKAFKTRNHLANHFR